MKQKLIVKRPFEYVLDGIHFRFIPGDVWHISRKYPGNPEKKQIHRQLILLLKEKSIF